MSSLWKLYLEYNNIERFPDTWCKDGNNLTTAWHHLQFPNLEQLRLDNNQLIHLQRDLLASMPKLMLLNVSFNEIETMPFLSAVGTSLMHAYLDHNKISHIELEHISGLSSLQTLRLTFNNIMYLDLHILANWNSLRLFDLRYNKLMTPPILANINLNPSMEVILTNNSFACDSRMCLLQNETLLMDELLCSTPPEVAGRYIQPFMESMYCGKY